MLNYRIAFSVSLLALALAGCKSTDLKTDRVNRALPASFAATADSASVSPLAWKQFFFDPKLVVLIDSALKHNYDLGIAWQRVQTARANLRQNRGIRLPEVGLNANASLRKFGEYTMDGVGNYDTQFSTNINDKQQIPNPLPDYYVGFQASWEIDLWGKLKNKKKAAASRFIASQYGKDLIITNLIAEIAAAYFDLLALDKEAQILEDNIALQQAALDLVTAEKEAGKANELGVELVQAQLLNSRVSQAEVKQKLLETESTLSFLCGSLPQSVARDTSYFSQHILSTINTGVPSDLLKNRPDIRQAELELKASNADVRSAKAAFYPSINISAALGLQSFKSYLLLETPASAAYNVLGGLAAPLLNRRRLKAELMASRSEQQQAYIRYEKTVVNSFREVYVAMNNISNSKVMFDLKKEEVDILKTAIGTSRELFKAGRANYLEVITSQKNALQSQIELIGLYKRQNMALVDLYRSTGGGWK